MKKPFCKKIIMSEREAKNLEWRRKMQGRYMRAYECSICKCWHMTTQKPDEYFKIKRGK